MANRFALALSALLALPSVLHAEGIYRWLDRDGHEHFGETPPPGATGVEPWTPSKSRRISRVPGGNAPPRRYSAPARSAPLEPTEIEGKREYQWRNKARSFEGAVESLEAKLEREKDRSPSLGTSSLSAARFDARKEARIEALKRKLEAAEQALDDFEDRARHAGVPPGWLR